MDMGNEYERLILLEHGRKTCEIAYNKHPLDADNLTRWGASLIELSQFQSAAADSKKMLLEAVSKLEEALEISPTKHETMWCLGNALTTLGLTLPDIDESTPYFQKAGIYYQQAIDEDSGNEVYQKSLDISSKAPELHGEIHGGQGGFMGGQSSSSTKTSTKKQQTSDFTYDVMGWVCLAVGVVAWLGFAKANNPS